MTPAELDPLIIQQSQWIADLLRTHPSLADTCTRVEYAPASGMTIHVDGGTAESAAWHREVGGRIRPHHVSHAGRWEQVILADGLWVFVTHREAPPAGCPCALHSHARLAVVGAVGS